MTSAETDQLIRTVAEVRIPWESQGGGNGPMGRFMTTMRALGLVTNAAYVSVVGLVCNSWKVMNDLREGEPRIRQQFWDKPFLATDPVRQQAWPGPFNPAQIARGPIGITMTEDQRAERLRQALVYWRMFTLSVRDGQPQFTGRVFYAAKIQEALTFIDLHDPNNEPMRRWFSTVGGEIESLFSPLSLESAIPRS